MLPAPHYDSQTIDRDLTEVVMHLTRVSCATLIALTCFAAAQETAPAKTATNKPASSDAAYNAKALSAAPRSIAKDAGIMRMDKDGKMQTVRESKNGFTCMVTLGSPMCADENSMAFFGAWMKHENPPDKAGITYMLRGDNGASNTDPYATKQTTDNHWIMTGAHIMLVGPAAKSMGLPDSPDADPAKPYLMWANTPYAHAMIPVGGTTHSMMAEPTAGMKDTQGKETTK
jgi:hypothetical protein